MINSLDTSKRNQGGSKFPFTDVSTLVSTTGLVMDPAALLDASVYPTGAEGPLYLSGIDSKDGTTRFLISGSSGVVCEGSAVSNSSIVRLTDEFGRDCGILIGGPDLSSFTSSIPTGLHVFEPDAAELVPSCVISRGQRQVSGFYGEDKKLVSGDVWLVGENGVLLEPGSSPNVISINCVGDPLFPVRTAAINGRVFSKQPALQRFQVKNNGVIFLNDTNLAPDTYGNLTITVAGGSDNRSILRVRPVKNGIRISLAGVSAPA